MLRGIDHIVIAAANLNDAVRNYNEAGFHVVAGGRHPIGTHNALIALADGAYIELISPMQDNIKTRWGKLLQDGSGLVDFCMQSDNLVDEIDRFRHAGIRMSDRQLLSRVRPDGYQLRWAFSTPDDVSPGLIPFLIQDETPRQERVPKETTHPNKVSGIVALTIAINDLPTISRSYAAILKTDGTGIVRDDLNAIGVRFTMGHPKLDLLMSKGGNGRLSKWLRERGPSLYSVTLKTKGGRVELMDDGKTRRLLPVIGR